MVTTERDWEGERLSVSTGDIAKHPNGENWERGDKAMAKDVSSG